MAIYACSPLLKDAVRDSLILLRGAGDCGEIGEGPRLLFWSCKRANDARTASNLLFLGFENAIVREKMTIEEEDSQKVSEQPEEDEDDVDLYSRCHTEDAIVACEYEDEDDNIDTPVLATCYTPVKFSEKFSIVPDTPPHLPLAYSEESVQDYMKRVYDVDNVTFV
jgi:hypothetical protein